MVSSKTIDPYKQDQATAPLTDEEISDLRTGNAVFSELGVKAPRGRPKSVTPKTPVTIRLDSKIVEHFKATGKGWQTRINEILLKEIAK